LKYRILSKMVWDILAVSITTVTSESSFSAGGHDWARALNRLRKKFVIDEDEAVSETFMHIFIMC
jgi:hypothetical protein